MIGGTQPKILVDLTDEGDLVINAEFAKLFCNENEENWKLVRERDNLTKLSRAIIWIEFNDDGTFKDKHKDIGIGYSLLMSPFNNNFTWQTTAVTEITKADASHIKFKTGNSNYTIYKNNKNQDGEDLYKTKIPK